MLLIDTKTKRPIYEQLYMQIQDKIMTGKWEFGMRLPSSRQLAKDLLISRNTVELAYQQLLAEGYLFTKPRSGIYVQKLDTSFFNRWSPIPKESPVPRVAPKNAYKYNFRYGKLDYRYIPFKTWKKILVQCYEEEMDGIVSYGTHQGEIGLREQITKYVTEHRGVKCNPEQIVVGAGTLYCVSLLCNLLTRSAKTIGFEDPGYGKVRTVFKNAGLEICPISVERDGINVRELNGTDAKAVYVTPSHQFPTGAIMSISKRLQLLDWAIQKQAIIIEDDYSCHFRYNVKPIPSLQGISQEANVVYLGSFSKCLMPSLRIAFMVLPPAILDEYKTIYHNYNTSVPYVFQKTLERFMREGYFDRHLRTVLQVSKKKHDWLLQALNDELGEWIEITGRDAGLFIAVKVNSELSERQLIQRAAEVGVLVYPMSNHWDRTNHYDGKTVLLGYSSLDLDEIKHAVQLLRKAWFER